MSPTQGTARCPGIVLQYTVNSTPTNQLQPNWLETNTTQVAGIGGIHWDKWIQIFQLLSVLSFYLTGTLNI